MRPERRGRTMPRGGEKKYGRRDCMLRNVLIVTSFAVLWIMREEKTSGGRKGFPRAQWTPLASKDYSAFRVHTIQNSYKKP